MKRGLLLLLTGFALGAVTVLLVPGNLKSRLPKALGGSKEVVSGRVVAKKSGSDELLLTVETAGGALLATFTQRIREIDLLVDEGDVLTLRLARSEPFVEDPIIEKVMKSPLGTATTAEPGAPAEEPPATPSTVPAAVGEDNTDGRNELQEETKKAEPEGGEG